MYDEQIGRWAGVDPYDEFASPYLGMGGDPVNNVDPSGGSIDAGGWGGIIGGVGGFASGYIIARNNGASVGGSIGWGLAGAFVGAGIGYGVGESLFGEGGGIGANMRAFYKGLFAGSGTVGTHWNGYNDPLNVGLTEVNVPNIWPSFEWVSEWQKLPIFFANTILQNTQLINSLEEELSTITGLNVQVNGNRLEYERKRLVMHGNDNDHKLIVKDLVNRTGTSIAARNFVKRTLAYSLTGGTTVVNQTAGGSNGGGGNVNLDPGDLNVNLSPGLNSLTFGIGMLLLHELGHTGIGGSLSDGPPGIRQWGQNNGGITPTTPRQFTGQGPTEKLMNKIRRQLGQDFGQRLSYLDYVTPSGNYLPFSKSALKQLQNFQTPASGSFWIR